MELKKCETMGSNGERKLGEELERVCYLEKVGNYVLEIFYYDDIEMKTVLKLVSEELISREVVVDRIELGVMRHHPPS